MQILPLKVLVVDDEVDAAESLAELLSIDGHTSELVHNGLEVLDVARRVLPDLVLMDIGLPGMNGYQVAKLIRQETSLDRALLVALTGWDRDADKRAAVEAGFDVHLVKPVSWEALRDVAARVHGLKPQPRSLQA